MNNMASVCLLTAAPRLLAAAVSVSVVVLAITAALPGWNDCCAAATEEPAWRTAFLRRGFMGELNAPVDVIRSPTPIAMQGTKAIPATGYKDFDKNPANELLRKQANQFIREELHPDAVADFDAVMSDPDNPDRMRRDFHCGDWLHPNDAGYQAMAAEAARQLRGRDTKHGNSGNTTARIVKDIVSTMTGVASYAGAGIAVVAEEAATQREDAVILTPKPPATPRINGARIFGVRPGHPFLFTIPATGQRPMDFSVDQLPEGLKVDPQTGQITGSIKDRGEYVVTFRAKNVLGQVERPFKIVCGDTLALTPPMGWSNWYADYGRVTDKVIRDAADAMAKNGMANVGYQYVTLDDCWSNIAKNPDPKRVGPPRDSQGNIVTNQYFPDMKALTDYIHARGLKAGIYSSPGPVTCQGFAASWKHEAQDAKQFADWGFDMLKYDWCSYGGIHSKDIEYLKRPYKLMGGLLKQQNRDILFNLCQYGMGDVWKWGAEVGGQSWRTAFDMGYDLNRVAEVAVKNAAHREYSKPGSWNDPDNLIIGYYGKGPCRMTPTEQYAYMSYWCLMAAPLFYGGDMTRLDEFTLSVLCNPEVIEIDQDALGECARVVPLSGKTFLMVKRLEDGGTAVGLCNRGEGTQNVTAKWSDLGLTGKQTVRDLWRQKDLGGFDGQFSAPVGRHGVVLLRLGAGE